MKEVKRKRDSFFWRRVRRHAERHDISMTEAAKHIANIDERQEARRKAELATAEGKAKEAARKEEIAKASAELKEKRAAEKARRRAALRRFREEKPKVRLISGGAPNLGKRK